MQEGLCDRKLKDKAFKNISIRGNKYTYSQGKSTDYAVVNKMEEVLKNKAICPGPFIYIEGGET